MGTDTFSNAGSPIIECSAELLSKLDRDNKALEAELAALRDSNDWWGKVVMSYHDVSCDMEEELVVFLKDLERERKYTSAAILDYNALRKAVGEAVMNLQKLAAEYELGSALDIPGYITKISSDLEAML